MSEIVYAIGIVGQKAAGKSEAAKFFKQFGFRVFRLSDPLRKIAAEREIENPSTQILQDIGNELRRERGAGILTKMVVEMAREQGPAYNNLIIIDGLRNPAEMKAIRELLPDRHIFIAVRAAKRTRAKRFLARKRPGDPTTLKGFYELDARDMGLNEPEEGQQVGKCLRLIPKKQTIRNDHELWKLENKLLFLWFMAIEPELLRLGQSYG